MSKKTIGILMPGDMGHGCGKVFLDNDLAVISALDGRSNRTKKLSESAGIENVGSIKNIVNYSDIILSILPPEAALEQAEQVNEVILENITTTQGGRNLKIKCSSMELEFTWNRGFSIPFKRSLFFISTVELFFAKLLFSTRTYGITKNNRKEWYAIDRVSKLIQATAKIKGIDVGSLSPMNEPCKFGFSEAPKKPSSCVVRTHIL